MQRSRPIITSLLDADWYMFTMMDFVLHCLPNAESEMEFTNRTKDVKIGQYVRHEDLKREFRALRKLRFTRKELQYLRGKVSDTMLEYLRTFRMGHIMTDIGEDGTLTMRTPMAPHAHGMLYESMATAIVNELYYRGVVMTSAAEAGMSYDAMLWRFGQEGIKRTQEKIDFFLEHPEVRFSEQGTRRRFSNEHQERVVALLAESGLRERGQFTGTSNVLLSMKHGTTPIGTMAHQMPMISAALAGDDDERLAASNWQFLDDWHDFYGGKNGVVLPDTFGREAIFAGLTAERAMRTSGWRHDSGTPEEFVDDLCAELSRFEVDPMSKFVAFSDGLTPERCVGLAAYCKGRIRCTFGIGTNLSNDVGLRPLSLVMKVAAVRAHAYAAVYPTCKLSDNPSKTKHSPVTERYKRVFRYKARAAQTCVV